jgi:hypothetical protein
MAISPEYLTLLRVGIDASPEWKEAWDRINDYLDALKVPENIERELVLLSSFEQAITRKRQAPATPATELAFEETQKALDDTLGHLIGPEVPRDRRSVEERIRLFLTEPSDRSSFKSHVQLSEEVLQALREVRLKPTPRLQQASITARPFRFSPIGEKIVAVAERLAFLGSNRIVTWCLALGIIGLLIFASL